jgi:predicted permease
MARDINEIVAPAVSSGLGVGAGRLILDTVGNQIEIIRELLSSVLILWFFTVGCFALAWGVGQWLYQNKDNRKWGSVVSFATSTFTTGVFPSFIAGGVLNNAQNQGVIFDLKTLASQYVGVMFFFGLIFLVVGALIIQNYVK